MEGFDRYNSTVVPINPVGFKFCGYDGWGDCIFVSFVMRPFIEGLKNATTSIGIHVFTLITSV
jgi:hypothetical protein